jgi:hypothetical protein
MNDNVLRRVSNSYRAFGDMRPTLSAGPKNRSIADFRVVRTNGTRE